MVHDEKGTGGIYGGREVDMMGDFGVVSCVCLCEVEFLGEEVCPWECGWLEGPDVG